MGGGRKKGKEGIPEAHLRLFYIKVRKEGEQKASSRRKGKGGQERGKKNTTEAEDKILDAGRGLSEGKKPTASIRHLTSSVRREEKKKW